MKSLALILFGIMLLPIFLFSQEQSVRDEIKTIENSLMPYIQEEGKVVELMELEDRMRVHKIPGISIAVIKNGRLHWSKGYGIANTITNTPVTPTTLFQAGSISKPIAALAALILVDQGKIDLDTDVNQYLKKWKIPENKFTAIEKVTIRRLLSHNAGITVHGFPGYKNNEEFPDDVSVLDGNGNTGSIYVDTFPGSIWRYSGGGYTIMENVVEDVSGQDFATFVEENVLQPIGISNSTYAQPLPPTLHNQASAAYDGDGEIIEGLWHNYPEQAAAGLWTTPEDIAKYCMHIQQILSDRKDGLITYALTEEMLTRQKNDYGLGPGLRWEKDSLLFQHGGKNAGFTNNFFASAYNGYGLIIMTNADNGGRIIGEIQRAVSDYYGWGTSYQKKIKIIPLDNNQLDRFSGCFRYEKEVDDIGEYEVKIERKKDYLELYDLVEKKSYTLSPLSENQFIDVTLGDELVFNPEEQGKSSTFIWNGRFRFIKKECESK